MNALWWYTQRITGAALIVLLIAHFWVEHFMSATLLRGDLTYSAIRSRIANPAWQAIDIAFLLIALFHGLSGLRNILLDFSRIGRQGARIFTGILIAAGTLWAYWGIEAFSRIR